MISPIDTALVDCLVRNNVAKETILVSVSGGIDSVSLLHAVSNVSHQMGLDLQVVHVNHGLRGQDSIDDAMFVRDSAQSLGYVVHVVDAPTKQHPEVHKHGIEATARMQRYDALVRIAQQQHARHVLTGHTLNDNVETFIMNAARGSGYKGLAGIPEVRHLTDHICVLRPLLSCSRAQVQAYANDTGLAWREDHTNSRDEYTRNRVRHNVVPSITASLGEHALHGIHASALHMRDVRSAMDELLAPYVEQIMSMHGNGTSTTKNIDARQLGLLSLQMQKLVLLHALGFGHDDTIRLLELLNAEIGSEATLTNGTIALRDRGKLVIQPNTINAFDRVIDTSGHFQQGASILQLDFVSPSDVEYSQDTAYFDAAHIVPPLRWRTWQDGDRLTPFGMGGRSALVSDVITNARIQHEERRSMQVLTDTRGILWLCGLRRSDRAPITHETDTVVRCKFSK